MQRLVKGSTAYGYPVASLRTEARKGRLALTRVAGKDYVSEEAIRDMERLCKRQRESGCGSKHGADESPSTSSVTERAKSAQVALETISKALTRPSRPTSPKRSLPTPGNVISLASLARKS